MSKLKEKFRDIDIENNDSVHGTWLGCINEIEAEQCEKIADDYAIEFSEWIVQNCNHSKLKFLDYKQLLETFKKEKGLI